MIFFYILLIISPANSKTVNIKKKQEKQRQTIRSVTKGVEENEIFNDVFYSPAFIERLEKAGIDPKDFQQANPTPEDQFVCLLIFQIWLNFKNVKFKKRIKF